MDPRINASEGGKSYCTSGNVMGDLLTRHPIWRGTPEERISTPQRVHSPPSDLVCLGVLGGFRDALSEKCSELANSSESSRASLQNYGRQRKAAGAQKGAGGRMSQA